MNTRDRGAAAVEFAIVLPVLISLILGIIAFGHAFFVQAALANAARDGVRVMALHNKPAEASAAAVSSASGVVALNASHVVVTPTSCKANGVSGPETATVTIEYPLELLGGIGNVTVTGKGTMRCNG